MPVILSNEQTRRIPVTQLRYCLETCLRHLRLRDHEVSVLLTDDRRIRRLNRTHRGQDRPTDVLSFGMREHRRAGDPLPPHTELLGDIVVSVDTAARQAAEREAALTEELRVLLIHGLLHLVGYDHGTPVESRRMDALQEQLRQACAAQGGSGAHRHRR